jgi:DNA-binding CsgD family transcriptional regulator
MYVLTFETGKIGLNLRLLGNVNGQNDVFVGWAPDMITPEIDTRTDEMIDLETILPAGWTTGVSFGLPQEEEAPLSKRKEKALTKKAIEKRKRHLEQLQRWEQLDVHEKEAVMMVCRGLSTEEMAKRLKVSPRTAQKYISRAIHKFGVQRRTELKRAMKGWSFGKDSITSRGG